jgi:hypothetical protein
MPDTTTEPGASSAGGAGPPGGGWRRLGWFVALWCGSLAAWLLFAYGLRWVMEQVGIAG